jgi:serine/threonine protein kinase
VSNPEHRQPADEVQLQSGPHLVADDIAPADPPRVDGFIGKSVTNFRITELIGRGAMGSVYKATHLLLDKEAAIKLLHNHLCTDEQAIRRFKQEAQSASRLEHPGIVKVTDFGVTPDGQPYLFMDFVEGTSLSSLLRQGPIDSQRALKLCAQVCDALSVAHSKAVVHRDIKPSNLIVTDAGSDDEQIKVVDFGIAKVIEEAKGPALTQTGEAMGSPPYMSPEQCSARPLDARSDVYSLGCVLYEMIIGHPPFVSSSIYEIVHAHLHSLPEPTGNLVLDEIILKAMAKDPAKRYGSAAEFRAALEIAAVSLEKPPSLALKAKSAWNVATARVNPKKVLLSACIGLLALAPLVVLMQTQNIRSSIFTANAVTATSATDMEAGFDRIRRAANDFTRLEQWSQAEMKYREALSVGADLGLENLKMQECMTGLGQSLLHEGKKTEGEQTLQRAAFLQNFADDRCNVVENAANIAHLTSEHSQNPNDLETRNKLLSALASQGSVYGALTQRSAAMSCAKTMLSLTNADDPNDFPFRIKALRLVARVHSANFEMEEAQKATAEMLKLCAKYDKTSSSLELAETYSALGRVYLDEQDNGVNGHSPAERRIDATRALNFFDKADKIFQSLYGKTSPWLADIFAEEASVMAQSGDYKAAQTLEEAALKMSELYRGINDPRTAKEYGRLAYIMLDQLDPKSPSMQKVQEVDKLLVRAGDIIKYSTTTDSETLVSVHALRGRTHELMKDYSAAEDMYNTALEEARKTSLRNDLALFAYSRLIEIYQHQGRHKDVEALMRRVKEGLPIEKPRVTDS